MITLAALSQIHPTAILASEANANGAKKNLEVVFSLLNRNVYSVSADNCTRTYDNIEQALEDYNRTVPHFAVQGMK